MCDLIKLYHKAIKVAKIKGYPEEAEDFGGWCAEKWLRGKSLKQTIDQSLIDFLRETKGCRNNRKRSADALKNVDYHNSIFFENGNSKLLEEKFISNYRTPDEELERKEMNRDYSIFLDKDIHISLYRLIIEKGFNLKEAGDILGFTESRASQLFSEIEKTLKNELILKDKENKLNNDEEKYVFDWIEI